MARKTSRSIGREEKPKKGKFNPHSEGRRKKLRRLAKPRRKLIKQKITNLVFHPGPFTPEDHYHQNQSTYINQYDNGDIELAQGKTILAADNEDYRIRADDFKLKNLSRFNKNTRVCFVGAGFCTICKTLKESSDYPFGGIVVIDKVAQLKPFVEAKYGIRELEWRIGDWKDLIGQKEFDVIIWDIEDDARADLALLKAALKTQNGLILTWPDWENINGSR